MIKKIKVRVIMMLVLFWVVGCTSVPSQFEIADDVALLTTLEDVRNAKEQGQIARLAGLVARVENLAERTRVEIVALPMTASGRPLISAKPQARFVAYIDGYIESLEYTQGKPITVQGEVQTSESGQVGEFEMTFPVLHALEHQLWDINQRVRVDDFGSTIGCSPRSSLCHGFHPRFGHIETYLTPSK
ncbi:Slp family lipoprotein [Thaumasiovibrio sp. DFM-14]|uniref:Slp family lipoprotein n=1 Tax=Thaumasiovibrio sp. DFM-14 TaxID=3384792 RepID=UPI0039A00925